MENLLKVIFQIPLVEYIDGLEKYVNEEVTREDVERSHPLQLRLARAHCRSSDDARPEGMR